MGLEGKKGRACRPPQSLLVVLQSQLQLPDGFIDRFESIGSMPPEIVGCALQLFLSFLEFADSAANVRMPLSVFAVISILILRFG